jgi:hypothetical protein
MEPETLVTGIPNTLPPQNKKECWSLAASESAPVLLEILAAKPDQRNKTPVAAYQRKTKIYNTLAYDRSNPIKCRLIPSSQIGKPSPFRFIGSYITAISCRKSLNI